MFSKIKLSFHVFKDIELEEKLKFPVEMIRLNCGIKFKTKDGWSDTYFAIVDTGAPISVVPFRIWKESVVDILAEHSIRGIIPKEECKLPVRLGKLMCVLLDEKNVSKEYKILAYLALTNKVPLILGFKNLIDKLIVHLNYKNKEAWLGET